jgi:hypothetical protein
METLATYQAIVIDFLEAYAKVSYANAPGLEQQVIADTQRNHFELVSIGWHKGRFVHEVVFHFDIKESKIWIQQNETDIRVSKELIARGVNASDIIVGFTQVPADSNQIQVAFN